MAAAPASPCWGVRHYTGDAVQAQSPIMGFLRFMTFGVSVPAVPPCLLKPVRDQFLALLPDREDSHPLGCHNPRIADEVVFDRLVQALAFGCGYERAADEQCSATTPRRRRDEWIALGVMEALRLLVPSAYDRMIGLERDHPVADGCITKAPTGGAGAREEARSTGANKALSARS